MSSSNATSEESETSEAPDTNTNGLPCDTGTNDTGTMITNGSDSPLRMPPAIPYIIGNEIAERFSFYGMKAILMIYMTGALLMDKTEAASLGHLFNSAVYFLPFFGALLADIFWGKFRVIFTLSIVYCLGHFILALPGGFLGIDAKSALIWGLVCIAVGAGGIKSCVSAIVGDQFNKSNQALLDRVFNWFYLSINIGSFFSMLLTPWLLKTFGPEVAFGVPGVLMALATIILWLGRKQYIVVPPAGWSFVKEAFSKKGLAAMGGIALIYLFLVIFWSVYDQNGYLWVEQASHMNPKIFQDWAFMPESVRNCEFLPAQVQAVNPAFILLFIPLFTCWMYPFINRFYTLTLVRKMKWGLILGCVAALFPWVFERCAESGIVLNLGWQVVAYVFLTAAEVLVSVSALEFAYTQAPRSMKSLIMSFYLLPISAGNLFTSEINNLCSRSPDFLPGASYYWFFVVLSIVNAALFFVISRFYKEQTILQE